MTRFAVFLVSLVMTAQALTTASAFPTESRRVAAAPESAERRDAFPAENRDPLEDAFFDILWLCDSPVERERDDAQAELARRFDEFERVWMNRVFLTDGEIEEEPRRRFLRAESDFWNAKREQTPATFDVELRVGAPDGEGDALSRPATVCVSWRAPLRVVWLAPDFRALLWRDPETDRFWRPRSLFSAPELQPETDSDRVELELILEPVPDDAAPSDDAPGSAFAFDTLVGIVPTPLALPLADDASEPRAFRSGELALRVFPVKRDDAGRRTVALRLDYDAAFDAFDSHRSWLDVADVKLAAPNLAAPLAPDAIRVRDRSPKGERLELSFPSDPALDDAFQHGAATLVCRFPRLFARLRIER